jgi:hypothetical protein
MRAVGGAVGLKSLSVGHLPELVPIDVKGRANDVCNLKSRLRWQRDGAFRRDNRRLHLRTAIAGRRIESDEQRESPDRPRRVLLNCHYSDWMRAIRVPPHAQDNYGPGRHAPFQIWAYLCGDGWAQCVGRRKAEGGGMISMRAV